MLIDHTVLSPHFNRLSGTEQKGKRWVWIEEVFPTFLLRLSSEALDEGEDEEDDEGGHADSSERRRSTCKAHTSGVLTRCFSAPKRPK